MPPNVTPVKVDVQFWALFCVILPVSVDVTVAVESNVPDIVTGALPV